MIETISKKIERCIDPKPLGHYEIDESFLYRLHLLLLKECVPADEINHYLVAFGLLRLHEQAHLRFISDTLTPTENILDGDYFYSLYYQYAASNAFLLIKHNFAHHFAKTNLEAINEDTYLIDTIKNFLQQEELYYGLS